MGWNQTRLMLGHAVNSFKRAVDLSGRSEEVGTHSRVKRSFLGLATSSDTGRLEANIDTLQAKEERTTSTIVFLKRKLQEGASLMKNFVHSGQIELQKLH